MFLFFLVFVLFGMMILFTGLDIRRMSDLSSLDSGMMFDLRVSFMFNPLLNRVKFGFYILFMGFGGYLKNSGFYFILMVNNLLVILWSAGSVYYRFMFLFR